MSSFHALTQKSTVSERYREWSVMMASRVASSSQLAQWLYGGSVFALMVVSMAWSPPLRARFALQPTVPFALLGLLLLGNVPPAALLHRRQLPRPWVGAFALLGPALTQAFLWSLVSYASFPWNGVTAGLAIVSVAFQGSIFLPSLRYPFFLASICAASGFGVVTAQSADTRLLVLCAGAVSLFVSSVLGSAGVLEERSRRERDALREAVTAQMLAERSRALEAAQTDVLELRSLRHDVSQYVSSALMRVQLCVRPPLAADPASALSEVTDVLARLRDVLQQSRVGVAQATLTTTSIDIAASVASGVFDLSALFPDVAIILAPTSAIWSDVCGEPVTVERVVRNLIQNACEGDGSTHATHVQVRVWQDSACAAVEIRDNGPGFPAAVLAVGLDGFFTTKPFGTGLGLYTARRIAAASGGALTTENLATGGARVLLRLPLSAAAV